MVTSKINAKTLLLSTVLLALLCAPLIAAALADDNRTPASDDNAVKTPDNAPVLIQPQDSSAVDNSSEVHTQGDEEGSLIASNTPTDNAILVEVAAFIAFATVVIAAVVVIRRRTK